TSQKVRKRIEEIFGWCKEIGGLRRTRKRGVDRVGLSALLILSAQRAEKTSNSQLSTGFGLAVFFPGRTVFGGIPW
ncbi:MAG: hypothetical protein RL514_1810, partial [Verrucomicrobiota bacterium]